MALWKRAAAPITTDATIPARPLALSRSHVSVTSETAMRHSAVWACLRLRANLISTMPVDAFREVGTVRVEVPKPPVLVTPGGERVGIQEWLYSTQVDLDRGGNCFGLITERSGTGLPARIDLVPLAEVSVVQRSGRLDSYRISGKTYRPADVWHERQWTMAGLLVGLSPIAYGAWTIGEYLSIQEFALDWFGTGGIPKAMLRNKAKSVDANQSAEIKTRFRSAIDTDGLFVAGADWEYEMVQAEQAGSQWLDAKNASRVEVASYFDCPADLIDAQVSGQSVTYANVTQRNMQLLIMHLGPAIIRREQALSSLLAKPRFVKLNTNALLRMDPKTQADLFAVQIDKRILTPSEARAYYDLPPLTDGQIAEFDRLWPPKNPAPVTSAR